ncbi:SDR family NAD(P)-dependent oxidoreductase [Pseudonocardia sp.]|uniref:SDR family NAD(P)-dependent oxidoreductase n=1 Tax=Pseudonocardia sp. TaxID=60912 RepID=UPI002605AFC7|nr:SDR family NAD(P)-dependent oxidoreductase [Pseudonocardia sp.]
MSEFAGRVAVVTGAASGIGRALAVDLAKRGARLALSDVDKDGLAETAALVGSTEVRSDALDVTDREAVLAYADEVAGQFGTVNQVYNNAGIAFAGNILTSTFEEIERVVDIDFWGVVNGTKAFLPHLITSGDGHVVNISSLFGLLSVPSQSAYNAAKFAVRGFTESLRQEMLIARYPVQVTCVHPGGIKTGIARNAARGEGFEDGSAMERFERTMLRMSPEKAAGIILSGVHRNRARVLVGNDAKVLDLVVRVLGSAYQRPFSMIAGRQLS